MRGSFNVNFNILVQSSCPSFGQIKDSIVKFDVCLAVHHSITF